MLKKIIQILILYFEFSYSLFPGETQVDLEGINNEQAIELSSVDRNLKNSENSRKIVEDTAVEQSDKCPICLKTIDLEQGITVCENDKHNMHRQCAIDMLSRSINRCPICRRDVVSNIRNNFTPEEIQQLTVTSRTRSHSNLRAREYIMRHPKVILGVACLSISYYSFFLFYIIGIQHNHNDDSSND
ncbi:MAG: hypothetical protein CMP11_08870 [Zetaproteobacteria bacterium]|nr:hypothetical protein [Pseudobdellovibrionaceae bacterium]